MKKFAILLLCGLLAMFSLTGCDVLLNSLLGDNGGVSYAEPTDDFIADFELITLAPTQSNAPSDAPASKTPTPTANPTEEPDEPELDYYGVYTSRDDVALYIFLYGELPSNFITKAEARALGWNGGWNGRLISRLKSIVIYAKSSMTTISCLVARRPMISSSTSLRHIHVGLFGLE